MCVLPNIIGNAVGGKTGGAIKGFGATGSLGGAFLGSLLAKKKRAPVVDEVATRNAAAESRFATGGY